MNAAPSKPSENRPDNGGTRNIRTGSAPHPTFGDALSPVDRVTEIFSGLVMVLTVS